MDMFPEKEPESSVPGGEAPDEQQTEAPLDAAPAQPDEQVEVPTPTEPQVTPPTDQPSGEAEPHHPKFDEAFAEMRQSLREEETKEKTGFGAGIKRWMQKVFRRKTAPLPEVTEARLDEFAVPEAAHPAEGTQPAQVMPEGTAVAEALQEQPQVVEEPQKPPTEASTFHRLVRDKMTGALPGLDKIEPLVAPKETASEDEAVEFLAPGQTQLKTEEPEVSVSGQSILTAIRGEEQQEQEVSSLRQAALEDYQVPSAEEVEEAAAPLPRKLRRGWRDMRPVDRQLLIGALAIIALAILGTGAYAAFTSQPTPTPPPMTPTTSIVPIPIGLSLPGGWSFPVKTGHVDENGVWNPTGAEWLQGTEICRWVSLPWSEQLEAVLRTLKSDDVLQLSMTNYDNLVYKVRSIQEVPTEQIQKLAPDTPSLLVILTKPGTSTRWVVIAYAQP